MISSNDIGRILIIGISGGLANILTNLLLKTYPKVLITGVDNRDPPESNLSPRVSVHKIRYTRSSFEQLFRGHKFDAVFHLARLSHATRKRVDSKTMNDINVIGTQVILEMSLKFHVKKVVVISTYHVYGAYADNPLYLPESSPLRATFDHPELSDVVEMDQSTSAFMWRYQGQISVVMFRPCNIIGRKIKNSISQFLTMRFAPVPMDYNPMFQFIHETDIARMLMRSLEKLPSGVYNLAPLDTISMTRARTLLGMDIIRLPICLVQPLARIIKMPFPSYLFDYLRYSCILGTDDIRSHLGDDFLRYSTEDAILDLDVREF